MSSTDIPQETIDLIVDNLRTDRNALRNCSLVSPSFLASSRRHRFSSITLYSSLQCERLLAVMSFSPEIIPMITALHVIELFWADVGRCFPPVLQLLADYGRLKIFHLEDLSFWSFEAKILRSSAIEDLFKSIWLNKVILDGFALCLVPVELVMRSPSLQHITFKSGIYNSLACDTGLASIAVAIPPPPSLQLRSLRLPANHAGPIMRYLQPSLSQLRSIVISTDHEPEDELRMLSPLQTIRLIVFNISDTTVEPLRSLMTIGLPRNIEHVAVCIRRGMSPLAGFPAAFYHKVDETLAAIITRTDAHRRLQGVSFLVYPSYPSPEEVEGYLPCLKQTGLLRHVTGSREEVLAALGAMEASVQ